MVGAPARAFSDFISGRIGRKIDFASGTVVSSEVIRDAFYAFELTEAQRTLFEEVYRAAEKLGVDYIIDGKDNESPVAL